MKSVILIFVSLALWIKGAEAAECACATAAVKLRTGAGTRYAVLDTIPACTELPFTGQRQQGGSYTWLHVSYNGQAGWAASNWLTVRTCGDGTSCYGDVNNLSPTGKAGGGVSASNSAVDYRITNLTGLKACMDQVATANCIEASLIGAIASRESNAGASLTADGLSRYDPNGYGIMQCDLNTSGLPCRNCTPRSCCHIEMMVKQKIIPDINYMKNTKFPSWPIERQVQAAVAAYNTGRSRVKSWIGIDSATTGRDYSNDVIARAQRLKNQHGWN